MSFFLMNLICVPGALLPSPPGFPYHFYIVENDIRTKSAKLSAKVPAGASRVEYIIYFSKGLKMTSSNYCADLIRNTKDSVFSSVFDFNLKYEIDESVKMRKAINLKMIIDGVEVCNSGIYLDNSDLVEDYSIFDEKSVVNLYKNESEKISLSKMPKKLRSKK